jgi:subfamily B ATP-binding cassette protein HlyB/CyaB
VKSLQLEPQLNRRYRDLLAAFLQASFRARQLGNTYGTLANGLEQLMSLLILCVGAYLVMTAASFTVGMLVAFQMFAARLSQPMLRLVGLWQQFQQARLAVQRLGDIMNAPAEPYRLTARSQPGKGVIEITDLSFRYADNLPYLYDGLGLEVKPGQLAAVMGPSGAGKSTLLHLISGALTPDAGTVRFDGRDVTRVPPEDRPVHTVFQGLHLFPHLSVSKNVSFALDHARRDRPPRAQIRERVERLLESVGLRGYGDRSIHQLSGGEKQRVAIARALVDKPAALLLDEPFAPLDRTLKDTLIELILSIKREFGVTIALTTHDWYEALRLSDRIAIVSRGRLAQVGTPQELYHRPRTAAIARLTGPMNIVRGRVEAGRFIPGDGGETYGIRPAFVRLDGDLEGTVEGVTYAGDVYHVRLKLDGTFVTAESPSAPEAGARVRFGFPAEWLVRLEADA